MITSDLFLAALYHLSASIQLARDATSDVMARARLKEQADDTFRMITARAREISIVTGRTEPVEAVHS
jgi:hypothetical protein